VCGPGDAPGRFATARGGVAFAAAHAVPGAGQPSQHRRAGAKTGTTATGRRETRGPARGLSPWRRAWWATQRHHHSGNAWRDRVASRHRPRWFLSRPAPRARCVGPPRHPAPTLPCPPVSRHPTTSRRDNTSSHPDQRRNPLTPPRPRPPVPPHADAVGINVFRVSRGPWTVGSSAGPSVRLRHRAGRHVPSGRRGASRVRAGRRAGVVSPRACRLPGRESDRIVKFSLRRGEDYWLAPAVMRSACPGHRGVQFTVSWLGRGRAENLARRRGRAPCASLARTPGETTRVQGCFFNQTSCAWLPWVSQE